MSDKTPEFTPDNPRDASDYQPLTIDPELRGRMLPGIAAITLYLSLFTLATIFFAIRNQSESAGAARYGVMILYTILAAGLFGLLKMKRWGCSIVLAGCLCLSATYFYAFRVAHQVPSIVQGLFMLLFFLYLVRPEVRDRMV